MNTYPSLAIVLALAGCPLIKTSSSTTMPGSPGSPGSPDSDDGSAPPSMFIKGIINRDQLATLRGMTPDQAKQELVRLGHDGTVIVAVVRNLGGGETFVEGCGDNKVCETSGDAGVSVHADITLFVNPTLTIDVPPP